MDYAEFKASLQHLKNKFKSTPGLKWGKPHLGPKPDPFGSDILGWSSTWVVTFDGSLDFIRLREDWKITANGFARSFFTYHYGPYEAHWTLETVECNRVVVRVDGISYFGKGCHIHDGAKENRIYQDQLEAPDLAGTQMDQFIENVLKIRYGKTVTQAFELKLK
jgi:hypothetical protein